MNLLSDYAYLLAFLVMGVGFVLVNLLIPTLVSPRSTGKRASDPYESGEVPFGSAWVRVDVYYYIFALIYLAFAAEAVFLFPVLVVYRELPGFLPFIEVAVFLGILSVAILYAWKKGVFEWK